MGKEEIIQVQLNSVIDFIASASRELLVKGVPKKDIIVSIPEYLIDHLLHQYNTNLAGVNYLKEATHICGCKVQCGYENSIIVFNKYRHLTKEKYIKIDLL